MLSEKERLAWIQLAFSENIGPVSFKNLIEYFKKPSTALSHLNDFALRGGRKRPVRMADEKMVSEELRKAEENNVEMLLSCEDDYPTQLKSLDDCPPVLYAKGRLRLFKNVGIAVVGNRNASMNGKYLASKFSFELANEDYTVISGMARGIDAASHVGALKSEKKATIAVMGTGMDECYPPENDKLKKELEEKALIVTEFPFGTKPLPTNFPKRNRIISGLAKGVLVVEAQSRSGSLITAKTALEQGREVFAVPGFPTDPHSEGCNKLIKEGAYLVTSTEDIFKEISKEPVFEFGDSLEQNAFCVPVTTDESLLEKIRKTVTESLSIGSTSIDYLIRENDLPTSLVNIVLTELEIAGKIIRLSGNRVALQPDAFDSLK